MPKLTAQLQNTIARPPLVCPVQIQEAPELSGLDEESIALVNDLISETKTLADLFAEFDEFVASRPYLQE